MANPTRVDASRFQARLNALYQHVRRNGRGIIDTEMARLVEELAKATTKPGKAERHIRRDLNRAFRPASNRSGAPAAIDKSELYRVLDAWGRGGRKLPVRAQVYFAERAQRLRNRGFLAAGWIGSGNPLRAKVPPMVRNHPTLGVTQRRETPTSYRVTITNKVRFAKHMRGLVIIVQKAMNKRAGSIKKNIEIMLRTGKPYQFR
jgi:hypothetical protein